MFGRKIKSIIICILAFAITTCTGCGSKEIFQKKVNPNEVVPVDVENLSTDTYYVKNGTKFYEVYQPAGYGGSKYSPTNIYWMQDDESLIPEYYKGEIIAYASEESSLSPIEMQRYKYNGYTLGLYGASIDEDGYIAFSVKDNTIKGSNMESIFKNAKSNTIRLISIDDKPVSKDNLNNAGCLVGLKKGQTYHLTFYAGTYYQTASVIADEQMLQYYETYMLNDAEMTKNGYLKLTMPEDAKSGYYQIDGAGFFKYYDFKKGDKQIKKSQMNDPYYTSQSEQFAQYSQQYFALVEENTRDAVFQITYDSNGYTDADIICTLIAPDDKTVYQMDAINGTASVTLDTAVAGRYTMNIYPKDISVTDAEVVSGYTKQDAMSDKKDVKVEKDESFMLFTADVIGDDLTEDDVWGTVTYEDGTSYDMTYNLTTGQMEYLMKYTKKGSYTIEVHHYETAAIQNFKVQKDTSHSSDEIINIEE